VIAPTSAAPPRVTALRRTGVEVMLVPGRARRVPFEAVMAALGQRGFTSVLIEGGGTVAAEALRAGVVDRVVLFVAPAFLGGDAVPALATLGIGRAADALRLTRVSVRQVGADLVVEGRPRWQRHPLPPAGSRGTVDG
jgi:diaminohydroxyphosphoribosylaminopyrimidine deaminase/5-amino-6-(5-phosphoribosylamino)uracil reductase